MSAELQSKIVDLRKLVGQYESNKEDYYKSHYKEAKLRNDYLNPFCELLDWDIRNLAGKSEDYRDVIIEDSIEISGKMKAPDYCFKIGKERKFYVEAKKPSVDVKESNDASYQIRRYGYTAGLPLCILTDFEEFAIYDTRIRPNKNDKAGVGRIFYCTSYQYEKHFEYIYGIFSKRAIENGSFDKFIKDAKNKRGTESVDKGILELIEGFRTALAKNIALRNKVANVNQLNGAITKIIDRIIFLRIAEDREVEKYGSLLDVVKGNGHFYKLINQIFVKANNKYNSELFKPEEFVERLEIDDKIMKDIIETLYYPDCPYEFSVLPLELLGSIYEQFLGKTIRLTEGHQAKIEEKPEVKKAGGVYYTPQYIVKYIVENTVGEKIDGLSPDKIEKIKICDPACGSGSFLIGAYQYLIDYHLKWYLSNQKRKNKALKEKRIYEYSRGTRLTIDEKRNILLNCIFGVDIDAQAVEVTKLSLLLKIMEGETQESAGELFAHSDIKLLPNLSDNVKCGNSLIGIDVLSQQLPSGQERELNRMDYETYFLNIMKNNGFDVIIGNPPYFSIDKTWGKGDIRLLALKQQYPEIYNDKTDILFYFICKAIKLSKGYISFIVSRAFIEAYKANKLRDYILKNTAINEIIDFQNFHVFSGVGITTCIIKLKKNEVASKTLGYKLLTKELQTSDLLAQLKDKNVFECNNIAQSSLDSGSWSFTSGAFDRLYAKIDSGGYSLGEILFVGQGMQTGCNNIFGKRTLSEIRDWAIPNGLYYKRATNTDIQRYYIKDRKEYLLYLEGIDNFVKLPKKVQNYLNDNKAILKERAAFKRGDCEW